MNVLEENRDRYLLHTRSRRRVALIVVSVIVAHVVIITGAARWKGWMPKPVEGLIRVAIFPQK